MRPPHNPPGRVRIWWLHRPTGDRDVLRDADGRPRELAPGDAFRVYDNLRSKNSEHHIWTEALA